MSKKFDTILQEALQRYQLGGFLVGDRVKFRKDCLEHPCLKDKGESLLKIIKACMEPGFDFNLRIGALKSVRLPLAYAGKQSDTDIIADVYIEYAPGLYRNPMTVSIECLELQDDGDSSGPIPNSIKRISNIHGPQKTETRVRRENSKNEDILSLPTTNTTDFPHAKKWNDSLPGAGNIPDGFSKKS